MTIREAVRKGVAVLRRAPVAWSSPWLDAELLLGATMKLSRVSLCAHPETRLSPMQRRRYHAWIQKRRRGEPVAMILGHQEFFGLDFLVKKNVCLIPRPETELVVERALKILGNNRPGTTDYSLIFDVGTGSGAIAIAVARHAPERRVTATDVSPAALRLAQKNAAENGVADRITFRKANLLPSRFSVPKNTQLLFLANLPYLSTRQWRSLPPGIRRYEPRKALDGGPDGLALYRKLLTRIQKDQRCTTWTLLAEIDPSQAKSFGAAVRAVFPQASVRLHKDLARKIRVVETHILAI